MMEIFLSVVLITAILLCFVCRKDAELDLWSDGGLNVELKTA